MGVWNKNNGSLYWEELLACPITSPFSRIRNYCSTKRVGLFLNGLAISGRLNVISTSQLFWQSENEINYRSYN